MATEYTYNFTDTNDDKLLPHVLRKAINDDGGITPQCGNISPISDTQFTIYFASNVDVGEEAAITSQVNNHNGTNTVYELRATVPLIKTSMVVTHDGSYGEYGDCITTKPESLLHTGDLTKVVGRVVGLIKTNGSTAKLRVKEANPDGSSPAYLHTETLPDTSGAWAIHKFFTTTPPRSGDWVYKFEADKNATTTYELNSVSLTLLEDMTKT